MIGIVIQARLGSKRLPNKIMLPFYDNKGVLELLLENLKKNFKEVMIIVATTKNYRDNEIVKLCKKLNVECFRGAEENVLNRFVEVGDKYKLDKIIRVCADNPFLDIESLKVLLNIFLIDNSDYVSFNTKLGVPIIKTHYGLWAEGVTLKALKAVKNSTKDKLYTEHVTNFIYENPKKFTLKFEGIETYIEENEKIRLTLDTMGDFDLLKEIYKEYVLFEYLSLKILFELIGSNKKWLDRMNKQIKNNTK